MNMPSNTQLEMAFLKTIQIVLVIGISVLLCSEGTRSSGSADQEHECYSKEDSPLQLPSIKFENAIVDSAGKKCYRSLSSERMNSLLTRESVDEVFANVSAEICPGWSSSKKCLSSHLKTRCTREEINKYQDTSIFNYFLAMTELLCEPLENFNLLNYVKQVTVEDGLSDCLSPSDVSIDVVNCVEKASDSDNVLEIPFRELITVVTECYIQPIKNCAQGNIVKELLFLAQSTQFKQARIAGYDAAWNQIKTPASTLLDLHSLLK